MELPNHTIKELSKLNHLDCVSFSHRYDRAKETNETTALSRSHQHKCFVCGSRCSTGICKICAEEFPVKNADKDWDST